MECDCFGCPRVRRRHDGGVPFGSLVEGGGRGKLTSRGVRSGRRPNMMDTFLTGGRAVECR